MMDRITIQHGCATKDITFPVTFALRDGKYRFECIQVAPPVTMRSRLQGMLKQVPAQEGPGSVSIDIEKMDSTGRKCLCGQVDFIICMKCNRHVCGSKSVETFFRCSKSCGNSGKIGRATSIEASEGGAQLALGGPSKLMLPRAGQKLLR